MNWSVTGMSFFDGDPHDDQITTLSVGGASEGYCGNEEPSLLITIKRMHDHALEFRLPISTGKRIAQWIEQATRE